jgi:hypothetical protein
MTNRCRKVSLMGVILLFVGLVGNACKERISNPKQPLLPPIGKYWMVLDGSQNWDSLGIGLQDTMRMTKIKPDFGKHNQFCWEFGDSATMTWFRTDDHITPLRDDRQMGSAAMGGGHFSLLGDTLAMFSPKPTYFYKMLQSTDSLLVVVRVIK